MSDKRKKYYPGFHLTEDEWEAWRFCICMDAEASLYARKRYPAHYLPHVILDSDGNGTQWTGFICWYHYKVPNIGGERNV